MHPPPLKKIIPLFSSIPPLKVEVLSSLPFLKIWFEAQLPCRKGAGGGGGGGGGGEGAQYNSLVSSDITPPHFFYLKLYTLSEK